MACIERGRDTPYRVNLFIDIERTEYTSIHQADTPRYTMRIHQADTPGTLIGSLLRLAAIAHIAALSIRVPAIHVARSATHRPLTLPGHHPRGWSPGCRDLVGICLPGILQSSKRSAQISRCLKMAL